MWNKALTDSVLMLCLSIVLFADQKNKKGNERGLLHRRESTLISTVLRKLVRFNPGLFPYKMGGTWRQRCRQSEENGTGQYPDILSEWIQKSSRGSTPPEPPPPHPPLQACNFGACLRNTSAFILHLLQHITPHILEGFSSHNPWIMCIWGNCGKEVLHFVTQSNNVVLNKQGFW